MGQKMMTVVVAGCCRSDGDDGDAGVERLQRAGHHRLRAPGRSTRTTCQHRADRALKGRSQELRSATVGLHDCVSAGLQWRERGQSENQWQTAQQLLLGTTCLKKNLRAGVCYEFRSEFWRQLDSRLPSERLCQRYRCGTNVAAWTAVLVLMAGPGQQALGAGAGTATLSWC